MRSNEKPPVLRSVNRFLRQSKGAIMALTLCIMPVATMDLSFPIPTTDPLEDASKNSEENSGEKVGPFFLLSKDNSSFDNNQGTAGVAAVFQEALSAESTCSLDNNQGTAGVSALFQEALSAESTCYLDNNQGTAGVATVFQEALSTECSVGNEKTDILKKDNEKVTSPPPLVLEEEQEIETETVVEERQYENTPYIVECTAYCPTGRKCYNGKWPIEGITLAGMKDWIGAKCNLYFVAEDGSVGSKIGTYQFHDTGFGDDPDGDGVGSIEAGSRIDMYMESYSQAKNWGIKKVYLEFLNH